MFHKGMKDNLMGESISLSEVTSMHPFKQKINLSNVTQHEKNSGFNVPPRC